MPCHPARARQFLKKGRAAVYRAFPFTIILKDREDGYVQPIEVKIDPGSKETGVALVSKYKRGFVCIWAAELTHRGHAIKSLLEKRSGFRRRRRTVNLRHREARFDNRTKPKGWLAPSLMSRVNNIVNFVKKCQRFVPITGIVVERVKFDMQKMQNPEISGVEYQQGELEGYNVKEYLLEKYKRTCAYCKKKNVPFEVEHVIPKDKGGSNRVSNLVLSCTKCNQGKGTRTLEDFLKRKPALLKKIKAGLKKPLRDAAAVNATRNRIVSELEQFGLPLETSTGAQTKYNRKLQGYRKEHWIDAAVLGDNGSAAELLKGPILCIKAMGRGSRQMRKPDDNGFPRTEPKVKSKRIKGFQTGDIVKAIVPKGKKKGTHRGRVAIRKTGSFNIKTKDKTVQGISYRHCKLIHKMDGYGYHFA
jgi:5-methylcytosine-specific restriction endonuclease McrA